MECTDEYVCSYQVAGMTETPRQCGKPAIKLLVWPPDSGWGTVTYCKMHWDSVDGFINSATEVTDVTPEFC